MIPRVPDMDRMDRPSQFASQIQSMLVLASVKLQVLVQASDSNRSSLANLEL